LKKFLALIAFSLVSIGLLSFLPEASAITVNPLIDLSTPAATSLGTSVDVDGNLIIAGDTSGGTSGKGVAFLFDQTNTVLQTYVNPSQITGEQFGDAVAIDGNLVVIADPWDDNGGQDAGIVYLYDTSGNLLQTINNPNPQASVQDFFGNSVSISGNLILIGHIGDSTGATQAGSAYLYDTSGNLLQTINNPTPTVGEGFGFDVSLSGSLLLIGSPGDTTGASNTGSVYLYDTSGNLLHTINNPTPQNNDIFGNAVSMDGNRLVVGARQDNTGATFSGSAYIYDTSGNLLHTLNNPSPAAFDEFGFDVGISIDKILVGARLDNTGDNNAGSVYLYDTSGTLLQTINNPDPIIGQQFGVSLDISGNLDYLL